MGRRCSCGELTFHLHLVLWRFLPFHSPALAFFFLFPKLVLLRCEHTNPGVWQDSESMLTCSLFPHHPLPRGPSIATWPPPRLVNPLHLSERTANIHKTRMNVQGKRKWWFCYWRSFLMGLPLAQVCRHWPSSWGLCWKIALVHRQTRKYGSEAAAPISKGCSDF